MPPRQDGTGVYGLTLPKKSALIASSPRREEVAMTHGTKMHMKTPQRYRASRPFSYRPQRPISGSSQANKLGDAKRSYERYVALARAAAASGDLIEAENLYQHAEHYFRLMREPVA
jgi:hypothetical protein